jgi:acyl-CoA thioesterase-1
MKKHFCILAFLLLWTVPVFAIKKIKVACIGDSITAGVGAKNRKTQTYPAQLGGILGNKYEVKNCGTSGIKMSNYLKGWQKKIEAFQPDIVTIKLGTNDTKSRRLDDAADKDKFATNYKKATAKLLAFLNGLKSKPKIYICYPVPVFKTMGAIREEVLVKDVIPAITEIAEKEKLPIIDLYKLMTGKSKLVPDGVHPNEHAYKIIAEEIAKAIKN